MEMMKNNELKILEKKLFNINIYKKQDAWHYHLNSYQYIYDYWFVYFN